MSEIRELKRRLEAARAAIEALDVALEAGRLDPTEHARQRAEREREAGRLFVTLRRAQREAREGAVEAPAERAAVSRAFWRARPVLLVPAAVVLIGFGVGAGVVAERGLPGLRRVAPPAGTSLTGPAPTTAAGALTSGVELEALRQATAREDAPTASLLQFAHVALDQGRLAEARRAYARVLARDPRNVEAITHTGAVLFHEGRVDEALAKVEEALRIDPRYLHAHWDKAHYLFHAKRDFPAAVRAGEAFLALVPEGPDADTIRALVGQARAQATKDALLPKKP